MWRVSVEGVKGMVEYFQEGFWIGVMFLDLGGDGDWVRVWRWGVSEVGLGLLVLRVRDDFG